MGSLSIQAGGKMPLPSAAARCRCRVRTPMPLRGACGCWYRQALVGLHDHFRGAQQARSAPRTNVRELFCGSKIMRNDSDEAERSERSPFGVVSAANGEELAGVARQVSGKAAPANGSASQVNGSSEASGEVRRASGPPEPSAVQSATSLLPVIAWKGN